MLERNFRPIDNDFISLWSHIIVNGIDRKSKEALEALAECGQVDAVKMWIKLYGSNSNETINYIVSRYKGTNHNQLFVMGLIKKEQANSEHLEDLARSAQAAYKKAFSGKYKNNIYYNMYEEYKHQIENEAFIKDYKDAISKALKEWKSGASIVDLQAANEYLYSLIEVWPIEEEKQSLLNEANKQNREIIDYIKEFKLVDLDLIEESVKMNPAVSFSFAKALLISSNSETAELKEKAKEILEKLSTRRHSDTFNIGYKRVHYRNAARQKKLEEKSQNN